MAKQTFLEMAEYRQDKIETAIGRIEDIQSSLSGIFPKPKRTERISNVLDHLERSRNFLRLQEQDEARRIRRAEARARRKKLKAVPAFDRMIEDDIYAETFHTWGNTELGKQYESLRGLSGQVDYQGEVFVVTHQGERHGRGGMDEGSPPEAAVTRIRLPEDK